MPAENALLEQAKGSIVMLIDDDAKPPPDWVEKHLEHYRDPQVGAVGGPADNYSPNDTTRLPIHRGRPWGRITWYGRIIGNMHDQPEEWRTLPACEVDHLVGYNMSLRRSAFDRFETRLRPYWQVFEADACLQARANGFRVLFDPSIVVSHYCCNTTGAYVKDLGGDLALKVDNAVFNSAFVLSKHTKSPLMRLTRGLGFRLLGSSRLPGPILAVVGAFLGSGVKEQFQLAKRVWKNSARLARRRGRRPMRRRAGRSRSCRHRVSRRNHNDKP